MAFDDWDPGIPRGELPGFGEGPWPQGGRQPQGPGQLSGPGLGIAPAPGGQSYRDPRGDDWLRRMESGGSEGAGGPGAGEGPGSGKSEVVELAGEGRLAVPGAERQPAKIGLDDTGLTLEVGGERPVRATYRDLSLIAINAGTALLVLGEGPDAMRWLLDRFGDKIGPLVRELRERRLRQRLADALVEVPEDPVEFVEFGFTPSDPAAGASAASTGVGQVVMHGWGFVLAPVDERIGWIRFRRAGIRRVTSPSPGAVRVEAEPGVLELRSLGSAATRWADKLTRLRDAAFDDAARFVEQLLPDAPFTVRRRAEELLVDGRPVRPDQLGEAWETVEGAVLTEPGFADSYRALVAAAEPGAPRWLAMSPESPGGDQPKIWFLVALPGNLVAMELVSEGSHATYCFRAMPRASYAGEGAAGLGGAGEETVTAISEALVDARFLREPMALPADQLRLPKYLRYRLALAALPSLAEARRRFVARIVHSSPESWNAAVQNLVAWHGSCRDDSAEWPGRAAQEAQVRGAAGEAVDSGGDSAGDSPDEAASAGDATLERPKRTGSPG